MSGRRAVQRVCVLLVLLFLGHFAVGQGAKVNRERSPGEPLRESERDNPQRRQEWFQRGRSMRGETAAALRLRAFRQKLGLRKAALEAQKAASAKISAPNTQADSSANSQANPNSPPLVFSVQWTNLGPAPLISDPTNVQSYGLVSGRITSVVVDQNDPTGNTVYVGAAYGGLWKSTNAAASPASAVVWTPLTDDQASLAIGAIAVQPGNSNLVLAGTGEATFSGLSYYGVGILRSTDGGATWALVTSADAGVRDFKGLTFSHLIFSADNPNLVVAGGNSSPVSTDVGLTDTTGLGVYFSLDAGQSWNSATITDAGAPIAPSSVTGIVFSPVLHAFFAAIRHHGYYKSLDGINWSRLASQPSTLLTTATCPASTSFNCPIGRGEITFVPGSATMYTWFVNDNGDSQGIFRSTDGGNTWTALTMTGITTCGDSFGCGAGGQGDYDLALTAVPNGANVDLYAGAVNLFKCSITTSNPTCAVAGSWLNLTHVYGCDGTPGGEGALAHVHPDQHAIDFSSTNPNIIYFGNDGGIYRTLSGAFLNSGACTSHLPFDNLNGTIGSLTQFIAISTHPTDVSTVLGGTQDNGSPAVDSNNDGANGVTWKSVNLGDGGYNAINPLNGLDWFTANTDVSIQRCQNGINCNVNTFNYVIANSSATNTPNFPDSGSFYNPYILDPQVPSRIIIGTCRVWRGNSSGSGFTSSSTANAISFNFDTGSNTTCTGGENHMISSVAAGGPKTANGSQVIYAGTVDGWLFYTTQADKGPTSWNSNKISTGSGFKISSIAIDPSDPTGQTAYLTMMGFGGTHVLKTTGSFVFGNTDITNNLPDAPANSVVVDPINPSYVYVGTDVGVFVTNDGVTWSEFGVLPNVPVLSMKSFVQQNSGTGKLVIGTHGRGVWQTDLASVAANYTMQITGPTTLYAFAGNTVTLNGTLTANNGYSSPVNIACVGTTLPATCTGGTFTPTPGGTPFSITISDPSNANFTFAVKAVGSDANAFTQQQQFSFTSFTLTIGPPSPASVTVARGSQAVPKVSFVLTASDNFTGWATVGCDSATMPANAYCTTGSGDTVGFSPQQSQQTVNMLVVTPKETPTGTFSVDFTVAVQGAGSLTQPFTLNVTPNPAYAVTLAAPQSMNMKPGETGTLGFTVDAVDGYSGTVALSCYTNLSPPGTCAVAPNSVNTFPTSGNLSVTPQLAGNQGFYATGSLAATDGAQNTTIYFQIALNDFSLQPPLSTVAQPGSAVTASAVVYPNGFSGQVAMSCDATAIDPAATCVIAGSPFTLVRYTNPIIASATVTVPANVPAGSYPVTIHAVDVNSPLSHDLTFKVDTNFLFGAQGNVLFQAIAGQSSATFNLPLTGTPAGNSPVTLSCAGLPAGATCAFSPSAVVTPSPNPTNVSVTVATATGIPIADYPFQIVGTVGAASKSLPATLKIGDYTVSFDPPLRVFAPWTSQGFYGYINSVNGYTGQVTAACPSGLPTGVTCSAGSTTSIPGAIFLNINIAQTVVPQDINLVVPVTLLANGTPIVRNGNLTLSVQDFTVSLSPGTVTSPEGTPANFTVNVVGLNGFHLPVTLNCPLFGSPYTCSFSPVVIVPGQPSTLTVTPTPPNPAQNTITVGAASTSPAIGRQATATLNFVDFQINNPPIGQNVLAGNSASLTFTINALNGFNGQVSLACDTGGSPGVTCSVSPSSVNPSSNPSVTVTVNTPKGIAGGRYNITLSGTGAGITHSNSSYVVPNGFHLGANPPAATVPSTGGSATFSVTALSDNSFAGTVAWSCPNLPAGVTCSFSPVSSSLLANGTATSTLTVNTTAAAPPGGNTVTVQGASGTFTATTPIQLVVGGDFLVSTVTSKNTVIQGQSKDYHVRLEALSGFSQPVTLACTGLPSGAACQINNPFTPTLAGQDAVVTVSAGPSATPGTYPFVVTGTSGSISHNAAPALQLIIQPAPDFQLTYPGSAPGTFPAGSIYTSFLVNPVGGLPLSTQIDYSCATSDPTVTCSLGSTTAPLSNNSISLTMGTTAATPIGDVTITVHAVQHGGGLSHDLLLTIHVYDYTVSQPADQTAPQGGIANYNLTVTGLNNFGGSFIYASCGTLPQGVGPCIFTPPSLTLTPSTPSVPLVLSLPIALNAPLGKGTLTIAVGDQSHTVSTSITVIPVQDFTFASLSSQTQPALAGQTVVFPLQLTPLNAFSGTVALSFTGCPTGAVCSFSPSASQPISNQTPATVNFSVQLPTSAPAANNNITVTAFEPNNNKTHTVALTVAVGTFAVTATPSTANVPPGGSANYTAGLTAQNLVAPVTIGCSGLAAGMACIANPPQILAGQTSTVTVSSTAGVTPPTNSFSITGTSLGATKTAAVTLKVVDFSLTSTTSSASVNAASASAVSLKATALNGFNSSVAFSCPPVAAGIACSFSPASVIPTTTGSAISASISTTAATPPGVYTVPLTATGGGTTHLVNFTLTVKSFHVAAQPTTAITPVGGGKATYTLTLFSDQGFNSLTTLTCATPLPTGVTCAFNPASVTPTLAGVTSTLTVTVTSAVPQGTNTLTIKATASPLIISQPVTLLTGADFSLATVTPQQTVQQTQSADFHVTATAIGGMNQPVTLSCSGLPAGASCQFSQNPVTPIPGGQDVDVTVLTALNSVPNTYTVTVQGVGGGVTHTTPLSLVVQFFPDFVFSTSTPLMATRPGQGAAFSAQVGKNGVFSSIVDLTCAGALPSGSTCQVQPSSVDFSALAPGAQSPLTVNLTTAGGTPLADSAFTLHGVERGGSKIHDLPLTLRVNDFHLSPPTPLTFAQTDIATYVVTVFADNLFNGPVSLACNNLPTNVGPCSFSANNFVPTAGGTAVTVTAPVGPNASVGQTSFDVVVSGGNTAHTVTEPLNIILVQDFTFASPGPLSQITNPGQTISWPLALTPLNSFSASVGLAISGCPAGFTCTLQPPPPISISNQTPQPVSLVVQVPANASAANSNITVTATGGGKTHAVTVTVAVQSFSLTISPTLRTVAPGAGAVYNVTVKALNGFSQQVLLGCLNPPAGVTCSNPLAAPGATVPITVMTAANIVSGTKVVPIGGALSLGAPPNLGVLNVTLSVSPATPTYTLTTTQPTKVVPVGTNASFILTVRATTTTFTSPVTFSCLGTQFTCVFAPASVTPNTTGTNLSVTATPASPLSPGSYPLTVQALGGVQIRQLALTINVADFTLVSNTPPQTILNPNGGTATYTVTLLTSSGFNTAVALSCPGNPSGVTCSFVPASAVPSVAGVNSTLTVTTTAASPKGQLNLTVQGAGSGLTHQISIQLTNGQDFQLVATPSSLIVQQGGNNSTSIAVNPIGSFNTAVDVTCPSVTPTPPAGSLSCSPPISTIAPGASAPVQINASPDLTGGIYTVSVQGVAQTLTHSIPVTVNVPDYTLGLALGPGVTDVLVGASTPISGSSTSIAGYSGSVALSCSVTPPLSCSGLPGSPISPTAPFGLFVTVPNGTTPGPYVLQVTGNDGAGHVHTATLNLAVRDFAVALNSSSATIEAGSSTSTTGTVAGMNGFTGAVQLSCPPDPNISCVFTPASVAASPAGTPFSVTISAAPVTTPNPYNVEVDGTSFGQLRNVFFNLTVTPTNDFNIAIAQPAQTINAGEAASFGFLATAINSFNATVTMTCTGAPAGMTCTPPAPFPVPPGGSFNVQVQTTLGVIQPGAYNLTLNSSGGGKAHSQTISVTVRDFSLSVTPATQQVTPGVTADYAVSIGSTSGFSNDVLLACSIVGSPAGATCSFDQADLLPGGSTTLHVTSTSGITPSATYTVNVTATSNLTVHSASVTIVVGSLDFSLSGANSINVAPGSSGSLPVTATALGGFNSSVSFSCSGGGNGITCTPPAAVVPAAGGTVVNVVIRVSGKTASGTYNFTLTATGGGKTHQFPFSVATD